jgi:hypothetical protein
MYISINAAMYTIFFTLCLLMAVTPKSTSDTLHRVEAGYASSLNLIAGAVFIIYGSQLMAKLQQEKTYVQSRLIVSKKVC